MNTIIYRYKSLTLEFPDIPSYLYPNFIRGYFDGDGSINKQTGGFSITSTKVFVERVNEILRNELRVENGKIKESGCHNGITHDLHFHRKAESAKIFDWLYADANLYLQRKYDIYKNVHCKNADVAVG